MKIADTRIPADVAAQFGLVSESFWQNNFQDVVLQRTVSMARDAKVWEFLFYCVNIENMQMTTRSLFELDNELTRIAMTSRNSSQLVITRSGIYIMYFKL